MKLLNFENCGVIARCQKGPKFDIYARFISSFVFHFSSVLVTKLPKSAVIFRQRQYSWFFHFSSFWRKTKRERWNEPGIILINDIVFDRSAVLWLVKRSADGRNFVLPSYTCTPKLKKELKWPRLNSIKSRDNNSGFRFACI